MRAAVLLVAAAAAALVLGGVPSEARRQWQVRAVVCLLARAACGSAAEGACRVMPFWL